MVLQSLNLQYTLYQWQESASKASGQEEKGASDTLVIAIAKKDVGIGIQASDIAWADREDGGRNAAILVK